MQSGFTNKPGYPIKTPLANEITYTLTPVDLVAWYMFYYDRVQRQWRIYWVKAVGQVLRMLFMPLLIAFFAFLITWGAFVVILGASILLQAHPDPITPAVYVAAFAGFLCAFRWWVPLGRWVLFPELARGIYRRQMTRWAQQLSHSSNYHQARVHRFTLTAQGFVESTILRTARFGLECIERIESHGWWSSLDEIVVLEEQVLFVLRNNEGAFVIPRRAFAEEGALHKFLESARAYQWASYAPPVTAITVLQPK